MAKALKIIGTVVAVVAIVAMAVSTFGVSLGLTAAAMATAATVASYAALAGAAIALASSFVKPPGFSPSGNPQNFVTNPHSPLPYGIGRSRMSGIRIHGETTDGFSDKTQNDVLAFAALLCAGGLIQGIDSFKADGVAITFDGSGAAVGTYNGFMSQKVSLGGSTALTLSLGTASMPGWTADHKLSGMAHALWMLRYDSKGDFYQAGVPEPAWVGRWNLAYDPRKDSTYPGGSGSHRSNDEATWEWTRNGALHALTWSIGRHQNGKRTLGIGAPIANIRVADFVEAANVADANNWKAGGFVWSSDSKMAVLSQMLQTAGAKPTKTGAMIGCIVSAPRVSITTIESYHLLDGLRVSSTKSRRDRFNTVIPRYRSENHDWEVISGTKITNSTYVTEDGGQRTKEIDFPLVQHELVESVDGQAQVGELSAYAIVNSREAGPFIFTVGPQFIGLKSGDCITLNVPEEGIVNQDLILQQVTRDPSTTKIKLIAETETEAKHAFALGQTTVPPPPFSFVAASTVPDMPNAGIWSAIASTSSDGIPSITVIGANEYSIGTDVLIRYRITGNTEWQGPIILADPRGTVEHIISPLEAETSYDVEISYRNSNSQSEWLNLVVDLTPINGLLATTQYPNTFPLNVARGHLWIDEFGRKWRFDGREFTIDGDPIVIYGEPLLGNGYIDAQDQAGPNAQSAAERALSVLECPHALTLYAQNGGVLSAGQLPKPIGARRIQDGVDVSSACDWSISDVKGVTAGTVTIDLFGIFTLPIDLAIAREAEFKVNSVHLGLLRSQLVTLTRLDAPASNTGTGGTTVSDSALTAISTNSFVAVSDILTVTTGSAGKIGVTGSLVTAVDADYPEGSFGTALIARYRPIAGSFNDIGTEATGIEATVYLEYYQSSQINGHGEYDESLQYFDTNGAVDLLSEQTGLTAATDYEVQLFAKRTAALPAKTIRLIGTFSAIGS